MNCLTRVAACVWAVFALAAQNTSAVSMLQGSVRDAQDRPVGAAIVQLKTGSQTVSVSTDDEGKFHLPALPPGTYSLHAEIGALQADFGPFVMGQRESKSIDLKLTSPEATPFFDPPSFIVAGVTDTANRGGHGSDPILHSTEALVKATASLSGAINPADDLETVRALQRAAEQAPTESHIFDWGAELLTHRAAEQAIEVFSRGNKLFPRSTRMLSGLAAAWYSRGSYDEAERFFFEAADLNPVDPAPYLLLGQVRNSSIGQSGGFAERMERFARLHPENAWANYYYAISLRQATPAKAQSLLEKAVRLDPRIGPAWLQLGIQFADRGNFSKAIPAWQNASAAGVIEAHYRLAQAYRRTGETAKAKNEIEIFEQLSKQSARQEERERAAIREFVFTLRDQK
jgi:tetratricopeptide (TPR) repeat protein